MRRLKPRTGKVARLALVLLAASSVGCAQVSQWVPTPSRAEQTPAERQMAEDNARFNETVLGGAAVGALAVGGGSYLLCRANGHSTRQCNRIAAIGTGGGALAGGWHGHKTATTTRESDRRLRENEAILANLKRDNAALKKSVASSNAVLSESKQRLEGQKEDVARGRKSLEQARADLKRAEDNQKQMAAQLDKAKKALVVYKDSADDSADGKMKSNLESQIKTMQGQIATMEQYIEQIDQSVKVNRV